MSRRRLTDAEKSLWARVAAQTQPLSPKTKKQEAGPLVAPGSKSLSGPAEESQGRQPLAMFRLGQTVPTQTRPNDLALSPADRLARAPVHMDKKTHGRMKRGKLKPEARLDLHGMTLAQAHPVLIRFIRDAHASGKRLVLVITGKGKPQRDDEGPIPQRPGLLRHAVPQWLTHPAIAPAVLQLSEAHTSHGGGGAYYVYLRKTR